jgi:outer membrane immunogenic protein
MRKILLSTVAFAALASQAFAADLPSRKEAPVYIAPAPIFTWTGFYVGVQLGGAFGNTNLNVPAFNYAKNLTNNGVFGGGMVGYNYQINNWVLGLQGEFNGAGGGSSTNTGYGVYGNAIVGVTAKTTQPWIASIDGRLGYAVDKALFYAIGGVAFTQLDPSVTYTIGTLAATSYKNNRSLTGYDVGGGVEYAFTNNWTGRVEYRYYGFNSSNNNNGALFGTPYLYRNGNLTDNTVRVGLAYKFGAPEPVVAKY